MKHLFQFSFFLLMLSMTNLVSAHAVVTNHSLKMTPVYPNKASQVELTFNSKIELGLSQVFLVKAGDQHESLSFSKGKQQGLISISIPALQPGKYALKFKVFAADGHLTEDVIHFTVAADAQTLQTHVQTQ